MNLKIKRLLRSIIFLPLNIGNFLTEIYIMMLDYFRTGVGQTWTDSQQEKIQSRKQLVTYSTNEKAIKLLIYTPNLICKFRANTFTTKEPETLKWINDCETDCVFFDIGANIGLYTLYFAASGKGVVYAFEPSVFNLRLLAKNVYENNLTEKVKIVTTPLTKNNDFSNFSLSSIEEGAALSAFGVNYGYDGQDFKSVLSYQTLGMSLDFLLEHNIIKQHPNLIKIDVDGIEHLILAGAQKTLKNPLCRSVLVEITESFSGQSNTASEILTNSGFHLVSKTRSNLHDPENHNATYNQIWMKK